MEATRRIWRSRIISFLISLTPDNVSAAASPQSTICNQHILANETTHADRCFTLKQRPQGCVYPEQVLPGEIRRSHVLSVSRLAYVKTPDGLEHAKQILPGLRSIIRHESTRRS